MLQGVHGERGVAGVAGVPVEFTLDIDEVCASRLRHRLSLVHFQCTGTHFLCCAVSGLT